MGKLTYQMIGDLTFQAILHRCFNVASTLGARVKDGVSQQAIRVPWVFAGLHDRHVAVEYDFWVKEKAKSQVCF